jgi:hypothetical protein
LEPTKHVPETDSGGDVSMVAEYDAALVVGNALSLAPNLLVCTAHAGAAMASIIVPRSEITCHRYR